MAKFVKRYEGCVKVGGLENKTCPVFFHPTGKIVFITVVDGFLIEETRLLAPQSLRAEVLLKLHDGHQGISRCREIANSSVW